MLRLLSFFRNFFISEVILVSVFTYILFSFPNHGYLVVLISLPVFISLSLLILYYDLKTLISTLCKTHYLCYEEKTLENFLSKRLLRSPLSIEASFQRHILLKLLRNLKKFFTELDMEDRTRKLTKSSLGNQKENSPLVERQQTLLYNLMQDIEVTYLKKQEFFESLLVDNKKEDFHNIIFSICEKYDESSFHIDLAIMKPLTLCANKAILDFFLNLGWRCILSLSKIGCHITFSSYRENSYSSLKWESDGVDFSESSLSFFNKETSQSFEKSALELYDNLMSHNAAHITPIGVLRLCALHSSARKMKLKTIIKQNHKGFSIKLMFPC